MARVRDLCAVALSFLLACGDSGGGGSGESVGTTDGEATSGASSTTTGTGTSSDTGAVDESGSETGMVEPVDPEEYLDRSLRDQVTAMEALALASEDLTLGYLARIDTLDTAPRGIASIVSMIEQPAALAASLDEHRGDGLLLQGAIIVVKDNLDMLELPCTAGSLALADNVPLGDAPAVARMREAGALLLGKTNLSEWANFRGYGSTSGWSSLGGQTKNGHDPAYNPCGSSSGSAAAVAAGLVSGAIGTETNGSIVCPAAINGVVGFKPTVGLVSRSGIIPISHSQDTAGPIVKTVGDAARVLTVIAGPDPDDPATDAIPPGLELDFEAGLDAATLDGVRLGVVTNLVDGDGAVTAVFMAELMRMADAGAVLVSVQVPLPFGNDPYTVLVTEFKVGIEAYLASHPVAGQPTTLAELIAFNQANAAEVMPYFGQEIFEDAQATNGLDDPDYLDALANVQSTVGENGILAVMEQNQLEALVSPTTGTAWMTNYAGGDPGIEGASTPAAIAGYPHLTVPMGEVAGLPVGLSIFAGPWHDGRVLELGHAYERLRP
jgi:amidase